MVRSFALLALFVVVGLVVSQDINDDFRGTWLDNFGYTWSLCSTNGGDRVEGSYSEFGIIRGDLDTDRNQLTGSWYETAFYNDTACPYGDFTFRVNGNFITGNYACWDGSEGGDWNASRIIPQVIPSLQDCVVSADSGSLAGSWGITDLNIIDICISGNQFFGSYFNNGFPTYVYGDVFYNGKLLQGSTVQELDQDTIVTGGSLIALYNDGSLYSFNWRTPITQSHVIVGDSDYHKTIENVKRVSKSASKADCQQNEFLKLGDDEDQFMYYPSSGAECSLIVGVFAIFGLLVLVL